MPLCRGIQGETVIMELEEFTCEQQEDGRWFVLRNGQFLVACPTESVAREIAEILRKDAAEDG
jgi:hypothetical protein